MVTRSYTSFSLDPTLKLSEMTKHLRRDDADPLRGPQRKPTLRQYTELTKFCNKLNILSFCNIKIYCRNLISCKAALQRLYREKRYTNNLELNIQFFLDAPVHIWVFINNIYGRYINNCIPKYTFEKSVNC